MVELLALVNTEIVRLESLHACKAWIAKAGATVSTIKPLGIECLYPHPSVVAYKLRGAGPPVPIGSLP